MLTEKDYCDRDTAVALQKLGYNNKYCRDDGTPIIVLYEALRWLREHRNIDVFPRRGYNANNRQSYQVEIYINYNRNRMLLNNDGEDYNSPEEALLEGVREAVKILKEK